MSWRPTTDPQETAVPEPVEPEVESILTPRDRDLGGFVVRRLLPASGHRTVGPFVFFDHIGPTGLAPGRGMDVRPHPHINLATVTYLFDGRDRPPRQPGLAPGDPARRHQLDDRRARHRPLGAHRPALRAAGSTVHGLQLWVGLPRADEETAPAFHHHPADDAAVAAPSRASRSACWSARRSAGARRCKTFSRLAYVDVATGGGLVDRAARRRRRSRRLRRRRRAELRRRALSALAHAALPSPATARTCAPRPRAASCCSAAIASPSRGTSGGTSCPAREARIEQAKRDWRERRGAPDGPFPLVPGDEDEFIPLPET